MTRTVKILVGFAGVAIAVTTVTEWMAPRVIAQVRAALVRDVDHPANAPFAWENINFASSGNPVMHGSFTVPATTADGRLVQRLVIETVSAYCQNLSDRAPGVRVIGPPPTPGTGSLTIPEFFFPFSPGSEPSAGAVHAQTAIYVNPGSTTSINLLSFEELGVCSFTLAGHFVTQ